MRVRWIFEEIQIESNVLVKGYKHIACLKGFDIIVLQTASTKLVNKEVVYYSNSIMTLDSV